MKQALNEHPATSSPPPVKLLGPALYFFLLALQTTGAAIIVVNGLPIYRQVVQDFSRHEPEPGILWWDAQSSIPRCSMKSAVIEIGDIRASPEQIEPRQLPGTRQHVGH